MMFTITAGIGYPLLALLVLLGALGLPLPLGVALATAGALARQGHVSLAALFVLCTAAAVAGDCLGYGLGRFGIARVVAHTHGRLRARLQRWCDSPRLGAALAWGASIAPGMGMLVFLTRWAVTAPSAVVNVLAGVRRYRWGHFLFADVTGEALWVALSLIPGYVLGGFGGGLTVAIAGGAVIALVISVVMGWFQHERHVMNGKPHGVAKSIAVENRPRNGSSAP